MFSVFKSIKRCLFGPTLDVVKAQRMVEQGRREKRDKYVNRILEIMRFSANLAGKSNIEVSVALKSGLKIALQEIPDPEHRFWRDTKLDYIAVSFFTVYGNKKRVAGLQIAGYGEIDNLGIVARGLEHPVPEDVSFEVELTKNQRVTPVLAREIAKRIVSHPDFESESLLVDLGSEQFPMLTFRRN